ncbi:HalOD1 output domain-containing protein [Haloarcula laminariae]|uniref:HalOD1 output domain-containing protein n=1 Tax=Haloarcula laminariae TaxID=2961577 RepID=UPI002405A66E|nr:HalOD1 output domain-containing protein [Halomicroarcula sp. FL173]
MNEPENKDSDLIKTPPDQQEPVYKTIRDDNDGLTVAILDAVASVSERDQDELPPLYTAIDVDYLNKTIASLGDDSMGIIKFAYVGYVVEVHSSGELKIW